ncbi:uncharacterized protein LOC132637406 [Lycium barbarum]|uniref:uncharacterized protein LOC132637406 n=1 Tax=Lycium barbarum TaxID=112863 RepID=UPI00293EE1D0|nr:uncharacterized protein LOC132637406 [Lycium barbarum]
MTWKVNSGSSSLWWDNWTGWGALAMVISHNDINKFQLAKDLIVDGSWNIAHLQLPEYLAKTILSLAIGDQNKPHFPIWMPTTNGKFTTSSKMLKNKNKLPFDNNISRYGIEVDTKCCCCTEAKDETIHHTFLDGELARKMWNYFGIPLGIPWKPGTIKTLIIKWWTVKPKNALYKDMLKTIPIIIWWKIWKARCVNRYDKTKVSKSRSIYQAFHHIKWIISKTMSTTQWIWKWQDLSKKIINSSHKIECIIVRWIKPPMGWTKLNTDGRHSNNDSIGAGGIIRDSNGQIIMSYAKNLAKGSSNIGEAKAIIYGLQWCTSQSLQNIILESDSLIIINMVKGKSKIAWQLQDSIDIIKEMLDETTNIVIEKRIKLRMHWPNGA